MAEKTLNNIKFRQRYDTEANWISTNPILLSGEIAISSDKNGRYKVGDGTSKWSVLSYNKADPTSHTHTKSQITDFPTSLKNPSALTIQGNGTTLANGTYDGSAVKTVNITPASIGAAASSHGTHVSFTSTLPVMDGTASAGTASTVARSDHKHPVDTSRAAANHTHPDATTSIHGLMTADMVTKLNGIATNANNYSLPVASSSARGGVKIGYSANGKNYPVQLSNEQMYVNVPWTDNNTWIAFKGATTSAAGTAGYAPAPSAGAANRYLRSDGTWTVPPDTNTTYSNFVKSGTGAKAGLVPAPPTAAGTAKYLREDGNWVAPPDSNTWRGIQNNLTSDSITESLSAAQGKALKTLIDGTVISQADIQGIFA